MTVVRKRWLLLIGLVALCYGLNYFVTPDLIGVTRLEELCRPRGSLKFDSETWNNSSFESGKRYEMVDDLLAKGIVQNLDASSVERLLGKPDCTSEKQGEKLTFYLLAQQADFPARSIWFPGHFPNHDKWVLEVRFRDGRAYAAKVFFT